jgi:hypothetical protein
MYIQSAAKLIAQILQSSEIFFPSVNLSYNLDHSFATVIDIAEELCNAKIVFDFKQSQALHVGSQRLLHYCADALLLASDMNRFHAQLSTHC